MKLRHGTSIYEKPALYKLRRSSNRSLFDDDEQYRLRMYEIIEDPFR